MQKRTVKKIAFTVLAVFVTGSLVLAIHIYKVTRPRVDAGTRVLVRLDIRQDIGRSDADVITAWLYRQKGVDRVLVDPRSDIAIFSFAPLQNSAAQIVRDWKKDMPYKAARYMPSAAEIKSACPVANHF